MVLIPREICRDIEKASAHQWLVTNNRDSYASTSIVGALTRREHGLLVTVVADSAHPIVTLAKVDEEVEVGGQIFKLGTNEYKGGVFSPDGFLYLHQAEYDGQVAKFTYEAGRFQLTKTIWMEHARRTTFIRYALAEHSEPVTLTLLPFCDYRSNLDLTAGGEQTRFQIQKLACGFAVRANDAALTYRIFVEPDAAFTPLDLWYWRFQLRAADNAQTDLFLPGLFRVNLAPGMTCTMIASLDQENAAENDGSRSLETVSSRPDPLPLVPSDQFNSDSFRIGQAGSAPVA